MNDEALEEIMGQLSSGNTITKEQCLYLMALYESRNQQVVQCVKRIRELENKIETQQDWVSVWRKRVDVAEEKLERVCGLLDGCDVYVCRPDDGNRLHLITDELQEATEQNEAITDD